MSRRRRQGTPAGIRAADAARSDAKAALRSRSGGKASPDNRWIASRIEEKLWSMNGTRDQFAQTLMTPSGGHVFRQAVLVQSGKPVQDVVSDSLRTARRERETWLTVVAGGRVDPVI